MIEVRASDHLRIVARFEVDEDNPSWVKIIWTSYTMDYNAVGLQWLIDHADKDTPADTMWVYNDALKALMGEQL